MTNIEIGKSYYLKDGRKVQIVSKLETGSWFGDINGFGAEVLEDNIDREDV